MRVSRRRAGEGGDGGEGRRRVQSGSLASMRLVFSVSSYFQRLETWPVAVCGASLFSVVIIMGMHMNKPIKNNTFNM